MSLAALLATTYTWDPFIRGILIVAIASARGSESIRRTCFSSAGRVRSEPCTVPSTLA